jgi:hypothetical protein
MSEHSLEHIKMTTTVSPADANLTKVPVLDRDGNPATVESLVLCTDKNDPSFAFVVFSTGTYDQICEACINIDLGMQRKRLTFSNLQGKDSAGTPCHQTVSFIPKGSILHHPPEVQCVHFVIRDKDRKRNAGPDGFIENWTATSRHRQKLERIVACEIKRYKTAQDCVDSKVTDEDMARMMNLEACSTTAVSTPQIEQVLIGMGLFHNKKAVDTSPEPPKEVENPFFKGFEEEETVDVTEEDV